MEYYENRALFLREFTRELIFHSKKEPKFAPVHQLKQEEDIFPIDNIFPQRVHQQIPSQKMVPESLMNELKQKLKEAQSPSISTGIAEGYERRAYEIGEEIPRPIKKKVLKFPLTKEIPEKSLHLEMPQQQTASIKFSSTQPRQTIQEITPSPQPLPQGFSIGKLNTLLPDQAIISIECPGPGKFVLVKKIGKVNVTKISLGEKEIREIMEAFSKQAKVPIIGGIFKAAVGNLVMTALISDFVGSRFVINRFTPYSAIQA